MRGGYRAVLVALTLIMYNNWLLWPLNGDPQALTGYLSELAAQDQPYQWLFRLTDGVAAVTFAVIAALGCRGWASWLGRWSPRVALAVLAAGVGTLFDAIFNLPCAESRDAACAATFSLNRRLHEAASGVVGIALVATIGLVALALAGREGWSRRPVMIAVFASFIGILLMESAVIPAVAPGAQGPIQMVQVPLCSAWIAYLAWRLPPGGRHA